MTQDNTPRIYVACLAAYNNGKLHGQWIDCDQDEDDIWSTIQEMLASSPEPDAEEWAIHDYENWEGIKIGENEDIEDIVQLAELVIKHGKAYSAYCEHCGVRVDERKFLNLYLGEFESEVDFIQQRWDDMGITEEARKIGIIEHYIDWDAIARDSFINDFLSLDVNGSVYVFNV